MGFGEHIAQSSTVYKHSKDTFRPQCELGQRSPGQAGPDGDLTGRSSISILQEPMHLALLSAQGTLPNEAFPQSHHIPLPTSQRQEE